MRNELSALYRAPDRHYHGLAHIEALLALAQEYRAALSDPDAVEAAIWFHDAIYDSRRSDNETRSAALALEKLAGRTDPERLARIAKMIEATATHTLPDLGDKAAGRDAALFLDMDLSILGAAAGGIRCLRGSGPARIWLGRGGGLARRPFSGARKIPRPPAHLPYRCVQAAF